MRIRQPFFSTPSLAQLIRLIAYPKAVKMETAAVPPVKSASASASAPAASVASVASVPAISQVAIGLGPSPTSSSNTSTPTPSPSPSPKAGTPASKSAQKEETTTEPPPVIITPCNPTSQPYIFEDGLRRVAPYHYTYRTWCKERWRGRPLIEIYEQEFRDRPLEFYLESMKSGLIVVNGKTVGPDYILQNGDLIENTVHRHETPVTGEPIGIIHEDDDMLVINKPAGVPVHPAGRYNFNSLVEIIKAERGNSFLPRPCNRLDRLTSGIMFMAKHHQAALKLCAQIFDRVVRKEYVARVVGEFPDGEIVCDQPILLISPKLGLNRVRANGKSARTVFKKLAYYPPTPDSPKGYKGYSIVRCLPVTGRTHQLRVHLQHLGHPIENDPIYANQRVWGVDLGRNDAEGANTTDEDVIARLSRMGKQEVAEAVAYYDEMVDSYYKKKTEKMSGELCKVCNTPLYTDPGEQELSLYLHSLRYEDANGAWSYCTPLPKWALPPDNMSGPTQVGGMEDLVGAAGDVSDISP